MEFQIDWLKEWSLYAPDSVAIHDGETGRKLTYRQCYELSQKMAQVLKEKVSPGDRVALFAPNEIESLLLFFALQPLGGILVPINTRFTPSEIKEVVANSGAKLLVHDPSLKVESSQIPMLALTGPQSLCDLAQRESLLKNPSIHQDIAMILYTSGTTGAPKGAVISKSMIFWNSFSTGLRLNLTQQDRTVTFLPLFHTGGWHVLTTPLLHRGGQITLLRKFDANKVLELCEKEKVSILFGVPTTMDLLSRSPKFEKCDLSSLRYAVVGGEPLYSDLIQKWATKKVPIRQGFGLTEFGPNAFSLNEGDALRKTGSIGFPNPLVEARVAEDSGHECAVNEPGELWLKGPMCMRGYWNNPEATQETIKEGWLATGDIVRRDEDGFYFVVGRKKDMFISGGENVYAAEVEKVIQALSSVREVAVVGVPDKKWGEVGKAFVVVDDKALTEEIILQHCHRHLAKFKIPKSVVFLENLPKGESGKVLKRELRRISD